MTALQTATLFHSNWMPSSSVGYNYLKQVYESGYNLACHSHPSVPAKSTDSVYLYLLNAKYSLISSLISKFSLDSVGLGSDCKFYQKTCLRIKYWWLKTVSNELFKFSWNVETYALWSDSRKHTVYLIQQWKIVKKLVRGCRYYTVNAIAHLGPPIWRWWLKSQTNYQWE